MIKKRKSQVLSKTKEINRNNSNSISCNNCSSFNISRDNNSISIWTKWSNKEGTRKSRANSNRRNERKARDGKSASICRWKWLI